MANLAAYREITWRGQKLRRREGVISMKSTFFKQVKQELLAAGFELVRNNSSHLIFRRSKGKTVSLPRKLDDRKKVSTIRRIAELVP